MSEPIGATAGRTFPRSADCLPDVFRFIDGYFSGTAIAQEHRLPMQFVIEEWFTNLVKYSRGPSSDILLEISKDAGRLVIRLSETVAAPFDIRTMPDVDVTRGADERRPGGLGIHLLRKMVDEIDYEYVDGRSTTTFVKVLES